MESANEIHPSQPPESFQEVLGRGRRNKQTARLAAGIAQDLLGSDGSADESVTVAKPSAPNTRRAPSGKGNKTRAPVASANPFESLTVEEASDAEDGEYQAKTSSSSASGTDTEVEAITNEELADSLPLKTVAARGPAAHQFRKSKGKKRKAPPKDDTPASTSSASKRTRVEDADEDQVQMSSTTSVLPPVVQDAKAQESAKRNPIYLFYESVSKNAAGLPGNPGDKHYKCFHGNRKILTITRAMRSSLNGLTGHLKTHFPAMYRLFLLLKDRNEPPTDEEKAIASGTKILDPAKATEYLARLEKASTNIVDIFTQQHQRAADKKWDQEEFEQLLTNWVVACDQPFDEVEKPEFRQLLEYTHLRPSLHIPHRGAIRRRIMKMGEDTVEGVKKMIKELDCKVSLSLDAWTSSNQHPFLAIVMHYITNDWKLEELLIDFRELIGEHSGVNMAHAVYDTMKMYGLRGRVVGLNCDNASNNDTMADELEVLHQADGFEFDATEARIRCMPHTVHLSALELLGCIGAVKKNGSGSAYQDSVTAPLSRDYDDDAVGQDDKDEDDPPDDPEAVLQEVLSAVEKLRKIIRAVRSSPQRRQAWLSEVTVSLRMVEHALKQTALMLILDVKTRWSSTHQMLRRALDYQSVIDDFVAKNRDLRKFEMHVQDWEAIVLVTHWLKSFRSATTQMSATKHTMLSSTHAIYRGLQESLCQSLRELPNSAPDQLKLGLTRAHRKLSDYYGKIDDSPYYTWASLLDPRISYQGLLTDCGDDVSLRNYLELSRERLQTLYRTKYARDPLPNSASTPPVPDNASRGSPQKVDFTARYKRRVQAYVDELEEYFKLPQENFDVCDPVQWWAGRRAQFPNLSRLARDILSIPGSAVAVERIFSGGRDTISLRRASLKPDTIRTLMLVKQRLRLARTAIQDLLGD